MLSAHFAPALVAKSCQFSVNLPLAMLFCMFPDLLHALLVVIGAEKFHKDYRYSHTLVVVLVLALIVVAGSIFMNTSLMVAVIYAGCVLSHYVLDLLNRSQMALSPWGGSIPGLGLHQRKGARYYGVSLFLEIFLIVSSGVVYGYAVFDGTYQSLLIPAGLLAILLAGEAGYYHIYAPLVEQARLRWPD